MITSEELKEIMLQYTEPLIRVAYGYVRDLHSAEDIVQDVFIKFYHLQNYEERGELKAYLTRMTVNKSKDYLKSWAYKKVLLQQKFVPTASKINKDSLVHQNEKTMIGDAILELPLKHREILIYFYFNEMTIPEVAKLLSIPESTVKTRLGRGRELLRKQLKGIEWEVLLNE